MGKQKLQEFPQKKAEQMPDLWRRGQGSGSENTEL